MAANSFGEESGPVDISIDVGARMVAKQIEVYDLPIAAQEAVWSIIDELAFHLNEYIHDVWPVDTRASQSSWDITADGLIWTIRNPREYAGFVHRKNESGKLVYKEIAARSEELLRQAWPRIKAAIKRVRRSKTTPGRLAGFQKLLLPSAIAAAGEGSGGTIFAAQVRAFERLNTRSRERARARAR